VLNKPVEITVFDITEISSGSYVVTLEGDFTYRTSPQIRREFTRLRAKGIHHIVADISRVRYIDSAGLATLIEAQQESVRLDIGFTLRGIRPDVEFVFELTKIRDLFEIAPLLEFSG
jgi:anti-sigma B factor antagonist